MQSIGTGDSGFINSLDKRISKIGNISWELGPGLRKPENNALVFSPNGDSELLGQTSMIVDMAPFCKGWEFYPAKPPKKWQMRFSMEDDRGKTYEIDAANWKYVLLKYRDDTFNIVIRMPDLGQLPEGMKYTAAEILLDGELGEEERIKRIIEIEIVDEFDDLLKSKTSSMKDFRQHYY